MNYNKSTKKLNTFDEVSREINKLYDIIANKQTSIGDDINPEGSVRIVEGEDKKIYLEIRGKFGWYTSCVDVFQFKSYSRPSLPIIYVSSQLYFAKKNITFLDVPSTILLGTIPLGYTLRNISGKIYTAFGDDNLIYFSDGGILGADNIIDLREVNTVFEIPLNKIYISDTNIYAILSGASSIGSMIIYLEAIKEI